MSEFVLHNVDVLGEGLADLFIRDEQIADPGEATEQAARIDCGGLIALPALVDPHTHLRDPGKGDAETIRTGLQAAARGGYGAVFAMPNTSPVADTAEVVEYELDTAREVGGADLYPIGAVTQGQGGEQLADLEAMAGSRAAVRMFSDDGHCVSRSDVMRQALERTRDLGGFIAQHAQDPLLTAGAQLDEGSLSRSLGKPGWPGMAESVIIARDAIMAGYLGARIHVCHVSTASGVEVVRWAKQQGIAITAEATPHHLALGTDDAATQDPDFKVNPPLRGPADVEAVRQGFLDGVLDMVGTDHAPHPDAAKQCGWDQAANGMLGLETALAVVADLFVQSGRMSWRALAERMSDAPARLLGIENEHGGSLQIGRPANVCLVDPDHPWRVDPARLASIAHNTPFKQRNYRTAVAATLVRGEATYDPSGRFALA